jgi:hypothetical protein
LPEPKVVETPLRRPSVGAIAAVAGVTDQDAQALAEGERDLSGAHGASLTEGDLRGEMTKLVRDPA